MELHILISASATGSPDYESAVRAAGGIPHAVYAPPDDIHYDGLLLSGGGDIESTRFGQENWGSSPPISSGTRLNWLWRPPISPLENPSSASAGAFRSSM